MEAAPDACRNQLQTVAGSCTSSQSRRPPSIGKQASFKGDEDLLTFADRQCSFGCSDQKKIEVFNDGEAETDSTRSDRTDKFPNAEECCGPLCAACQLDRTLVTASTREKVQEHAGKVWNPPLCKASGVLWHGLCRRLKHASCSRGKRASQKSKINCQNGPSFYILISTTGGAFQKNMGQELVFAYSGSENGPPPILRIG